MTDHLSGAQAFERLKAMRTLLGADAPHISIYRRRRDRKIIHVSLQTGDMTWYYHRGKLGGSTLLCVPTAEYRGAERWPQKLHKETFPLYSDWLYESVGAELAAVTRRAFIPRVFADLYKSNPFSHLMPKDP
jgi:hypothetical protein